MDKKYLATHRIPELINKVIIQLVDTLPTNPQEFLAQAILSSTLPDEGEDSGYPSFTPSHRNLLCQFLTPQMYNLLRHRCTKSNIALDRLIQPGVDVPRAQRSSLQINTVDMTQVEVMDYIPEIPSTGIVAGDEECYQTFEALFQPIIAMYHSVSVDKLPDFQSDFTAKKLFSVKSSLVMDTYVLSVRLSAARNLRGFTLLPCCSRAQRRKIEKILATAIAHLSQSYGKELTGEYAGYGELMSDEFRRMVGKGLVFDKPTDGEMLSGQVVRDWPDARGIFVNGDQTAAVWVNVTDHAKVVSLQRGGDLIKAFEQVSDVLQALEAAINLQGLGLMFHSKLGYLTTSPKNVGTAMRVSVRMKLPQLVRSGNLDSYLQKLNLQAIRVPGYDQGNVFDVSNIKKLGITEVKLVEMVAKGTAALVDLEKKLESGLPVDEQDIRNLVKISQAY